MKLQPNLADRVYELVQGIPAPQWGAIVMAMAAGAARREMNRAQWLQLCGHIWDIAQEVGAKEAKA